MNIWLRKPLIGCEMAKRVWPYLRCQTANCCCSRLLMGANSLLTLLLKPVHMKRRHYSSVLYRSSLHKILKVPEGSKGSWVFANGCSSDFIDLCGLCYCFLCDCLRSKSSTGMEIRNFIYSKLKIAKA